MIQFFEALKALRPTCQDVVNATGTQLSVKQLPAHADFKFNLQIIPFNMKGML